MLQAFTFRYTCNIATITKPVTKLNNQNVEGVNNDIRVKKKKKRVKIIYFDKKKHDIEETNTETFMCRSMSATNAYTEL